MNSGEVLEKILVSDSHQDIVSKYVGANYDSTMEVIKKLISQ
jgi:hypothetical protein